MTETTKPIENSHELIERISMLEPTPERQTFFRGHDDERYTLEPSLFRKKSKLVKYEPYMFRELVLAKPEEFALDKTTLDKLARMQHFGLPTRLLDLTSNPLMALFFACKDDRKTARLNGEVIMLSVKTSSIKFYDSDTVSCLANLSLLDRTFYDAINTKIDDITKFNETKPVERWLHHIKEEKPYFKNIIESKDVERVLCVRSKWNNNRISFQSGSFLLFGRNAQLPNNGNDEIIIVRFTVTGGKVKEQIRKQLEQMNINASTVYPLLESSARYIADVYRKRGRSKV